MGFYTATEVTYNDDDDVLYKSLCIYIYIVIYRAITLCHATKYNKRERATNYHTVQHVTLSYCYSIANGAS